MHAARPSCREHFSAKSNVKCGFVSLFFALVLGPTKNLASDSLFCTSDLSVILNSIMILLLRRPGFFDKKKKKRNAGYGKLLAVYLVGVGRHHLLPSRDGFQTTVVDLASYTQRKRKDHGPQVDED